MASLTDIHVEGFGGVFRYPLDETELAQDITQCGNRQEQHAHTPFFFHHRLALIGGFMAQNREFRAQCQHENTDIQQADAGIDPVPFDMACQQHRCGDRENHPGHAEE
ncbi:Uncharacterised protein [Yersinia enterocolitica]|nr:Uncharacterised protein [Yersinia enterocolitica]